MKSKKEGSSSSGTHHRNAVPNANVTHTLGPPPQPPSQKSPSYSPLSAKGRYYVCSLPHGASDSTADSCPDHPDGDALPSPVSCAPPFWTTSSCLFTAPGSIQELYSVITNAPIRQASEEKDPVGKVTRD